MGGLTVAEKQAVGTIERLVGGFSVRSSGAGLNIRGRLGFIKVTDDALALGAVPDPMGDLESSWMYNQFWSQEDAANVPVYYNFDVKSRRRLDGYGQSIAFVIDAEGGDSDIRSLLRV